jgi:hypothetical protein
MGGKLPDLDPNTLRTMRQMLRMTPKPHEEMTFAIAGVFVLSVVDCASRT